MIKSCLGCKHESNKITAEPCFSCVRVNSQSFEDYYEERGDDIEDHVKSEIRSDL
jgi:hypothetical protein